MFNVLTLNKIAKIGTDKLSGPFGLCDTHDNPDAVLVRSADMHNTPVGDKLLCVARAGAGVNNIPCEAMAEKGVVVFNTPGANANAVRELVVCALMLASRDIAGGLAWAKTLADKGPEVPALVEKGKSKFVGPEITGKTLGVVGLGAIGVGVANAASALGMDVFGFDPFISVDSAWGLSSGVKRAAGLSVLFAECDYITLHLPLTPQTKHTVNTDAIAQMKDGVRIINTARGDLVDDSALIEALKTGKIARYVTDFPNAALVAADGVVAIPHLGASTPESEDNCAVMAALQTRDYLLYGNIKNSVNYPDVELPWADSVRICVAHRNIPNMVGGISAVLASKGLNIENMVNKSRKAFAYTLIDIGSELSGDIEQALSAIDGVLRVRVLKS